jgi:hypothetical protein
VLATFPEVDRVLRVLTMQMGPHSVLVTGELQVHAGLETLEVEDLIARIDERISIELPEVRDTFWELRRAHAPRLVAET